MKKFLASLIFFNIFSMLFSAQNGNYSVKVRILQGEWDVIENCESRRWVGENWGRGANLSWGTFHERKSLRVTTGTSDTWCAFRTASFPLENWHNNVELVRISAYVEFPDNTADLKLDPKKKDGSTIEPIIVSDITSHQWLDLEFNINQSNNGYSEVRQIFLVPEGLGSNPATFYIDNIRLIMTNGTTYYWDVFESSSSLWTYGGDGYAYDDNGYQTTDTAITWYGSTSTVNSSRIYMKWNSGKDGASDAKVESDFYYNLRQYIKVKAQVRCSATNANIAIGFWNNGGGGWKSTEGKNVSLVDTWQTIEWYLPDAGTSYYDAVKIIPIILNTNDVTTGEIFFDDIQFYK